MVNPRGGLDLSSAKSAFNGGKKTDESFMLFFTGLGMLIIGSILSYFLKELTLIYFGLWIGASGLVSMAYAAIKLIKSIFYF